jgi:hypothetical protein
LRTDGGSGSRKAAGLGAKYSGAGAVLPVAIPSREVGDAIVWSGPGKYCVGAAGSV